MRIRKPTVVLYHLGLMLQRMLMSEENKHVKLVIMSATLGNLRSYLSTTRLQKLTVVFEYYDALETYSRIFQRTSLESTSKSLVRIRPLFLLQSQVGRDLRCYNHYSTQSFLNTTVSFQWLYDCKFLVFVFRLSACSLMMKKL